MKKYLQLFTLLFAAVMMPTMATAASADVLRGDVNGDNEINISDAIALINFLSTGNETGLNMNNADCTLEGDVNISDAIALINYLSTNEWPAQEDEDYVDLGLESGTLWATRNVGADSPEEIGDFFAWGEVEPKEVYNWGSYAWAVLTKATVKLTKYNTKAANGYNGTVDDKTELELEDDAAYVNYPNGRMPSKAQLEELVAACTWEWTELNGVNGQLVTGPNGNTIFLPAGGYHLDGNYYKDNVEGHYWMRELNSLSPTFFVPLNGTKLFFSSSAYNVNSGSRGTGYNVRAVKFTEE